MGLGRLPGYALEVRVVPVPPGEADHRETRWKQASVGQVVDGWQQLLASQVTGDAEDDERAGFRDPGQSPILGIPQWVHAVSPRAASSTWARPSVRLVR